MLHLRVVAHRRIGLGAYERIAGSWANDPILSYFGSGVGATFDPQICLGICRRKDFYQQGRDAENAAVVHDIKITAANDNNIRLNWFTTGHKQADR